jgi:hypothetical protein
MEMRAFLPSTLDVIVMVPESVNFIVFLKTWGRAYMNAVAQGGLKLSTNTWATASVSFAQNVARSAGRISFIRGGVLRPDAVWQWEKLALQLEGASCRYRFFEKVQN